MPHEGVFFDRDGNELKYEPVQWNTQEGEEWKKNVDDIDLTIAANTVLRIENPETGEVAYNTIVGEWESWESIDILLEGLWGEEGDTNFGGK